jgi:hypothetical protein
MVNVHNRSLAFPCLPVVAFDVPHPMPGFMLVPTLPLLSFRSGLRFMIKLLDVETAGLPHDMNIPRKT